jgi:hypothetical protein
MALALAGVVADVVAAALTRLMSSLLFRDSGAYARPAVCALSGD